MWYIVHWHKSEREECPIVSRWVVKSVSKAISQSRDCWENEITPGTAHQPVRTRHTHTLPYTVYKVYLSSQRGLWPHLSSSHDLRYTRVLCCPGPRSVFWVFNYFEFSSFLRETRRARSRSDRRNITTGKDLRRVFSSSAVNIFTWAQHHKLHPQHNFHSSPHSRHVD